MLILQISIEVWKSELQDTLNGRKRGCTTGPRLAPSAATSGNNCYNLVRLAGRIIQNFVPEYTSRNLLMFSHLDIYPITLFVKENRHNFKKPALRDEAHVTNLVNNKSKLLLHGTFVDKHIYDKFPESSKSHKVGYSGSVRAHFTCDCVRVLTFTRA